MNNTILSWEGTDYQSIYLRQIKDNPLYYDPNFKLWVIYSYEYCKSVLLNEDARVPEPVFDDNSQLNDKARLLLSKMARLSNDVHHHASRNAAMLAYRQIKQLDAGEILEALLQNAPLKGGFDWVDVVAKQLPVRIILKGLGLNGEDADFIAAEIATLSRIMLPHKTNQDIKAINPVVNVVYDIAERYLASTGLLTDEQEQNELIVCNLISLFIQCYDGGRGLLCNAVLDMAAHSNGADKNDLTWYKKLVNETLRLHSPVHNTRRIAVKDIEIGGQVIRAGESILVVLAAANIDGKMFKDPVKFDMDRSNNDQHLTFGAGGHNCVAKYLSIDMAVNVCRFLAGKYQNMTILQKEFSYEPQLNVRLVKELMISLS